uniref:Bifunctional arginine demethylase and lysyl-hydroxylase JMJD6 n=1 Tax=Lygus hesperus TaxID=30085 RepID=A0A0K8TCI3_LYGHE
MKIAVGEITTANPVRPPETSSGTKSDLCDRFVALNESLLRKGVRLDELRGVAKCLDEPVDNCSHSTLGLWAITPLVAVIFVVVVSDSSYYFDGMMKSALSVKCVLPNNYVFWEATRPVMDCRICSNLTAVKILNNLTRSDFKPFAYSYQPILVKGAAAGWPAVQEFDYAFFKRLFEAVPEAYKSVDEDCQFLNFKSNFTSLQEVFSMPEDRVRNSVDTHPWYIGWSNCHPEVLKEMRKYYEKPHFLPEEAEHSHIEFVFMGYQQGAFMHLDYISRLMWQAQLKGHKVWRLTPTPECESVCSSISFTVSPGDILLLDTRQWYHDTYILDGEFSITVSSEYG